MAIYHFSVKPVCRSAGRSATAAAAYRAAEMVVDQRTGEVHDYTRKAGVVSADIVLPDGEAWALSRSQLWNAAEFAERRKDACVAREFEVALPAELSPEQRKQLAHEFAKDIANREGCAVDVCIHLPSKDGDQKNHHAHMLRTTRKVEAEGLGAKLDTEQAGRKRADDLNAVRARWAEMTNAALERAGHGARVDHRSLEAQGIDRVPTEHKGPIVTAMERRGEQTRVGLGMQERAAAVMALRKITTTRSNRNARFERKQSARLADLPNLHRVHSVHDARGNESVLPGDAPDQLRQQPTEGDSSNMQQPQQQQPGVTAAPASQKDEATIERERVEKIRAAAKAKTQDMTADQVAEYRKNSFVSLVSNADTVAHQLSRQKRAERELKEVEAKLERAQAELESMRLVRLRTAFGLGKIPALKDKIRTLEEARKKQLTLVRTANRELISARRDAQGEVKKKYGTQFDALSAIEQAKRALEDEKKNPLRDEQGVTIECQDKSLLKRVARNVSDFVSDERGIGSRNDESRMHLAYVRRIRSLVAEGKNPADYNFPREILQDYELSVATQHPGTDEDRLKVWLSVADREDIKATQLATGFDHDGEKANIGELDGIKEKRNSGDTGQEVTAAPKKKKPRDPSLGM